MVRSKLLALRRAPRRWNLAWVFASLWLVACGRFGFELLPAPASGVDDDAAVDASRDGGGADGDATTGECTTDGDADGAPDCVDACPRDANKQSAGACGCGVSEQDTDLDGVPDCVDRCAGNGASYTPDASCGVGYCREHNTASSCASGVETSCVPGTALSTTDSTCDGVDDDCDGQVDEDFAPTSTSCGVGVCGRTGSVTCTAGREVDSCVQGAATSATDANCNKLDEDCDGDADDDFPTRATMCGMGACSVMGVLSCVDGAEVDSCTAPTGGATRDTTCNNIDDDCDGRVDEDYVVTTTNCGVGACARTGQRTCVNGREVNSCSAAAPAVTRDTVCNNLDDDCDGRVDEDYVVTTTNCGTGYCAATGQLTCVSGAPRNSCTPRAPRTTTDDAFSPGNGVDDDCDGRVDEDVPACNTSTRTFEAGAHTVAVPGNCKSLTVRLWGGAGASGQEVGSGSGGAGGSGGYASATVLVNGTITLQVGGGGASGCDVAGSNAGFSTFNGGSGGNSSGANGADGAVSGGGAGASPGGGSAGGRGHFGGGGGGQGNGSFGPSGNGGGGGAASVLVVNGTRAAVAGGGGGGGGAAAFTPLGTIADPGGAGGAGCAGTGSAPQSNSGGGGGGGVCQGSTTTRGTGITPANASSIPSGRARGGSGTCAAGGAGYATITFAP